MADNTVFDSAFKTMMNRMPSLLVPFINEAFGREYPLDEPVIQLSNEHEEAEESRISDSVIRLGGKLYHIECQSTQDTDMVVRMIEYDFAIALEGAIASGTPYVMEFPESCVLFLRHEPETPDALRMQVNLPDGTSFDYKTKVVKAQRFSCEEIFEKKLLILLPYYLMRYEDALAQIDGNEDETAKLIATCAELRSQLEKATLAEGDTVLYEQLLELIIRVVDHMMRAHNALREKVRRAMGGEVLELLRDRAEREIQEAREEGLEIGIEQGIEQGIEKGIEQGIEQGINSFSKELEQLGVSPEIIEEAKAALGKQE